MPRNGVDQSDQMSKYESLKRFLAACEHFSTTQTHNSFTRTPGRIDRYLPWSEDVPDSCRLTRDRVDEGAVLPDEPIVDAEVLEALPEGSWCSPASPGKSLAVPSATLESCWQNPIVRLETYWQIPGTRYF